MSGRTTTGEAVDTLCRYVYAETLATELGLETPMLDVTYADGYRGLTAAGQSWRETHIRLEDSVTKALGYFPTEDLPQVTYAPAWDILNLTDISPRVAQLPCWGGTF
jgi:phage tail protein X